MSEHWEDLMPAADQLLASAVNYLIQGDQRDEALTLLFCEADCVVNDVKWLSSPKGDIVGEVVFTVYLTGPRAAVDAYNRQEEYFDDYTGDERTTLPVMNAVNEAFRAVAPPRTTCRDVSMRVQLVDIQEGWREELKEIAHGRRVHNQGGEIPGREIIEWGNLRFRSQSEARIAKALDAMGVLFLPNCLARLNNGDSRLTKEADFLICSHGKWGILEVDGPAFHPRAAEDHERDRLFQQHGIKVTQRFSADSCYQNAPGVVRRFLTLLEQNG